MQKPEPRPALSARLSAIRESQESQSSCESQEQQEQQDQQESQASVQQSHTGLSQEMEDVAITNLTPPASPGRVIDSAVPALSYGVVCVASRVSNNRRQKEVKPFALQNTFFAYPTDTERTILRNINEKIDDVVSDFELQGYTVEKKIFPLPFAVEEICRVSAGYNMTAKKLKAVKSAKRKHGASGSDDESSGEDSDGDDDAGSCSSASVASDISSRKIVRATRTTRATPTASPAAAGASSAAFPAPVIKQEPVEKKSKK